MERSRNIFQDVFHMPYSFTGPRSFCNKLYGDANLVQRLQLERKLEAHNGCVNSIVWSDNGENILSGSDDQKLVVSNPFTGKVISCSGDGLIYYTQLERPEELSGFDCHFGTVYEVLTVPQDPHSFLSCGEDCTVRWYDLRIKDKCTKDDCKEDVLINCLRAVTAIATNPVMPYQLAVGCSDSSVRIYDRRMLGTKATGNYTGRGVLGMMSRFSAPGLENSHHRITSLSYSHDGTELLASYSSEHIYLFNLLENKHSAEFSADSSPSGSGGLKSSSKQPPIKRLRLRGDWSDTGPSARPERERRTDGNDQAAATIMQRMSDMLTRWLEGTNRREEEHEFPVDRPSPEASANQRAAPPEVAVAPVQSLAAVAESGTDTILGGPLPCLGEGSSAETTGRRGVRPAAGGGPGVTGGIPEGNLVSDGEAARNDDSNTVESATESEQLEADNNTHSCANSSDVTDGTVTTTTNIISAESPSIQTSESRPPPSITHPPGPQPAVTDSRTDSLSSPNTPQPTPSDPVAVSEALSGSVVEPLVSLQYRSLGTCASTIRLDCRVRHNVDCAALTADTEPPASPPGEESASDSELSMMSVSETAPELSDDRGERLETTGLTERSTTERVTAPEGHVPGTSTAPDCSPGPEEEEEEAVAGPSGLSTRRPAPSAGRRGNAGSGAGLVSSDEEREDSDDEDIGELDVAAAALRRNRLQARDDMTAKRHRAACKLQELYRKRQEAREREEQALMRLPEPVLQNCYRGHRNARTMIKEARFWGRDHVVSGSDCGHVFVWDRYTSELVMLLEGDKHVVNCVQPHPHFPILATSGIDYDIKLWTPNAQEPSYDRVRAQEILKRNEVMLEETKDTITVPASFMLRMLASLNHFRNARRGGPDDIDSSPSSEENDD